MRAHGTDYFLISMIKRSKTTNWNEIWSIFITSVMKTARACSFIMKNEAIKTIERAPQEHLTQGCTAWKAFLLYLKSSNNQCLLHYFLVKLVRIRSRHSWLKIFKWLKGNAKKPMNSCSFFIDCYTKADYLISTKVFGFWWLCCNHIIDYELLMQIVCVLVYAWKNLYWRI